MRADPRTLYLTHPECVAHDMGAWHPESPDRLRVIEQRVRSSGLERHLTREIAAEVSLDDVRRVHRDFYLEYFRHAVPEHGYSRFDPDTQANPHTWQAALHAAGAAVQATDAVIEQRAANAFCAVRPPGHHARPARAMGFCFINHVAVAARRALDHFGLQRVAVVDFDVHHGNGTEECFADDERVLMASVFQHPFYPFSGTPPSGDHMVNVPLPAGADGEALRDAVEQHWMAAFERHRPQMLFISAGFDAHADDPLGGLTWCDADYGWISTRLLEIADQWCEGRVVSVLEGGYDLDALARSVHVHLEALAHASRAL